MTLQNHTESSIKLLFLADTHLGFDAPLRPKVQRRRRGDDFFNNYRTALQPAYAGKVDVLVHGGDMFFRSRVHPSIVQAAFEPLLEIADLGIPIFIIPGNHERSNIPRSLLENHPGIHIFEQPQTHVLTLHGKRLALVGFANIGQNPRLYFKQRLEQTGWQAQNADIRVLCMHQAIEGAQVGVQNYTFRDGPEVIRGCDIPPGFAAVLSGHIHRHQVLTADLAGKKLNASVFYPGSTERTSFAEQREEKGYIVLTIHPNLSQPIKHQFVAFPSRPMMDLAVACQGVSFQQIKEQLISQINSLDENAVVRVRVADGDADVLLSALSERWLRSVAPKSMNISWSCRWRHESKDTS